MHDSQRFGKKRSYVYKTKTKSLYKTIKAQGVIILKHYNAKFRCLKVKMTVDMLTTKVKPKSNIYAPDVIAFTKSNIWDFWQIT